MSLKVLEQDMPPGAAQARGQWALNGSSQLPGEAPVSSSSWHVPGCVPGKVCVVGAGLEGRPGTGLSPEGDGKPQQSLYCRIAALKEDASEVEGARRSLSVGWGGVLSLACSGGGMGRRHKCARPWLGLCSALGTGLREGSLFTGPRVSTKAPLLQEASQFCYCLSLGPHHLPCPVPIPVFPVASPSFSGLQASGPPHFPAPPPTPQLGGISSGSLNSAGSWAPVSERASSGSGLLVQQLWGNQLRN